MGDASAERGRVERIPSVKPILRLTGVHRFEALSHEEKMPDDLGDGGLGEGRGPRADQASWA